MTTSSPIIVALDFPTQDQALAMADRLDPSLCRVKVGKELYKCLHQWELLEMGCSMILSKPNTVTYKKNIFCFF